MSSSRVVQPTRRPGGRTAEVTRRVNAAVLELLRRDGLSACTLAAVAERAGVERSTLYRRYGDRWAMMIDAVVAYAGDRRPESSLGSFREDLRLLVRNTADFLASPLGPAVWTMAAAVRSGAAPEHQGRYWDSRLQQILPLIESAKQRGELGADADPEEILCFALGAVHFRMFVLGERLDQLDADLIVDRICELYCAKSPSVEMKPSVTAAEIE